MSFARRQFLQTSALGCSLALSGKILRGEQAAASLPPARVITQGPRHHWFGYYDKFQFDPTGRFVLGMQTRFEHRSPVATDVIQIGMVDLQDGDRWIKLGESTAWNWQQGCQLQWLPGSSTKVLWNDRSEGKYVCRILDIETREERVIPHSIYSVSPDGKMAVTTDYRRIGDVRPGYGYAGYADPYANDLAPEESGISLVNLETGDAKQIISIAQIAALGEIPNELPGIKHYFNHLLFNPDGTRFIALHRWQYREGNRLTRLITANPDGSDIRIVIPNGYASHFIWRDPKHLLVQSRRWLGIDEWANFLFEDKEGGTVEAVGYKTLDGGGHLSYLPGNEWVLNDTYPKGKERLQTPHLYHIPTGRRIDLGHFPLPPEYNGEWRCDTHPRLSPDARYVCIDSPVAGAGRQMHLIDIQGLVDV